MTSQNLLSLFANASQQAQPNGGFFMPEQASTVAAPIDDLFFFIFYLSAVSFALVMGAMIYFCIKYRRKSEGQKTSPIEGNTKLEIIWTIIPTALLVVVFVWGFRDWVTMNIPPADAMDIRVKAQKWSWAFEYGESGVSSAREMVVPVNKPVKLTMSSVDVIHSFYVPAFRIKKDVTPGRYQVVWFTATKEGTYDVFCTEYCGTEHSTMYGTVRVVSQKVFDKWIADDGGMANLSSADRGKKLFKGYCTACHSITKDRMALTGPPLGGSYGKMETLVDGSQVKIDDNYIRESILEPSAKVVKGYPDAMTPFKGMFKEEQLGYLIDYIKTLK